MLIWSQFALVAVLLGSAAGAPVFNDVYEGYLFVIHEDYGMILASKDNNCFFLSIDDLRAHSLYSATTGETMDRVVELVSGKIPATKTHTSPGTIHSTFHDEFADSLCLGKQLYDVRVGSAPTLPPVPTPDACHDSIPNCHQYREEGCMGIFEPWAHAHCPVFCGYCTPSVTTPPKPCVDENPQCEFYNSDICTNPVYHDWVQQHCRKFCGTCN